MPAQRRKKSESKPAPRTGIPDEAKLVGDALARVKDPMMRYFLWMFIDLLTERIEQLDTMPLDEKHLRMLFPKKN